MRYVFLFIGALAASAFWAHREDEKAAIKDQLSQVPGYTIMPD